MGDARAVYPSDRPDDRVRTAGIDVRRGERARGRVVAHNALTCFFHGIVWDHVFIHRDHRRVIGTVDGDRDILCRDSVSAVGHRHGEGFLNGFRVV